MGKRKERILPALSWLGMHPTDTELPFLRGGVPSVSGDVVAGLVPINSNGTIGGTLGGAFVDEHNRHFSFLLFFWRVPPSLWYYNSTYTVEKQVFSIRHFQQIERLNFVYLVQFASNTLTC